MKIHLKITPNKSIPLEAKLYDDKVFFTFPYNKTLVSIVRNFGGAKWDKSTKIWTADAQSFRTKSMLGRLAVEPIGYKELWPRYRVDENPFTLKDLMPHQNLMATRLLNRHRVYWAADMGLGKTLSALRCIQEINEEAWVIAPKSPILTWKDEIIKWGVDPNLIKLISCSSKGINRAMEETEHPPKVLIVDEMSKFKNPTAQRTKLLLELSHLMYQKYRGEEYVVGLSGTPAPKNPTDWWSQIECIIPGAITENSPKRLMERLAEVIKEQGAYGGSYLTPFWKEEEINRFYKYLQPIVTVLRKKDCLSLPEKIYQVYTLEPTAETISAARVLLGREENTLTLTIRLRQLSDGVLNGIVNTPKDELLLEILEELRDNECSRVVIYAAFIDSVHKIRSMLNENGWSVIQVCESTWSGHAATTAKFNPHPSIRQFQSDDLDWPIAFVATAGSGGMGLNLTASDTIIFYSNTNTGEDRFQAEDRIHRIGMKGARIIDLIYLPTDRKIMESLQQKRNLQDISLGELKDAFK